MNDIPDHLRESDQPEWTLAGARVHGGICTAVAAVILATALGLVSFNAPVLTRHLILNFVCGFMCTHILFSVMHHTARMICPWCSIIVVACVVFVLSINHFAVLLHMARAPDAQLSVWSLFGFADMVFRNAPALVGTATATWLCWDGDFTVSDLLDLLMINPLTGRRV